MSPRRRAGRRFATALPTAVAALWIGVAAPAFADDASPANAGAATQTPEQLFAKGAAALSRGELTVAIDTFEALADQGFVHPDASYDRGLAYVQRYRAHAEKPGDLGRAAAAFEEALLLRPRDADADVALDLVRAEVTRKRARRSKDTVDVRPTLDRVLVGLADEETWGLAAFAASLALAVGLVLRPKQRGARAHIAGSILVPSAAVALVALAPLAWGARALRLSTRAGVVVATESFLTDEHGKALGGDPMPEAASVEVGERRDARVHVRWGAVEGWAPASDVRVLGAP